MCSWWWVEIPPETCRTVFQKKINYVTLHLVGNIPQYKNLRCADPRTFNSYSYFEVRIFKRTYIYIYIFKALDEWNVNVAFERKKSIAVYSIRKFGSRLELKKYFMSFPNYSYTNTGLTDNLPWKLLVDHIPVPNGVVPVFHITGLLVTTTVQKYSTYTAGYLHTLKLAFTW